MTSSLADLTAAELSALLATRQVSATQLVESMTERLDSREPQLHAFTLTCVDDALREAELSDTRRRLGFLRGPLDGIPYAVKDLFDVAGQVTRAGSRHRGDTAERDSAAVAALRAAGMVLMGRTVMDEFAYGMTSAPARNALDSSRSPGGSSGGSAAAVGSGEVPIALGSDTGGSVQVPAALNGVLGFKPSHGLLSTEGTTVLSPSLDHVGVIARSVDDISLTMAALRGNASTRPSAEPSAPHPGRLTIMVPTHFFTDRLSSEVRTAYEQVLLRIADAGHRLSSFEPPLSQHYAAVEDLICITEFAAAQGALVRSAPGDFGAVVRHYIEVGYRIPLTAYRAAKHAQEVTRTRWITALGDADLVLTPIAPITAPPATERLHTWADGRVDDVNELLGRFAVAADITGLPAITIPARIDSAGMPVGMQLIGRPSGDAALLGAAAQLAPLLTTA